MTLRDLCRFFGVLASAPMLPSTKLGPIWLALLVLAPTALAVWIASHAFGAKLERADFVFDNSAEVSSLDPATANGVPESRLIRALYEGLFLRDPTSGAPELALAEGLRAAPDGKSWTFAIRKNARWSNGDVITAHDFEWNLRRVLEPATGSGFAQELWCIRGAKEFNTGVDAQGKSIERDWSKVGVKATDDVTLTIDLDHPVTYLTDLLACYQLCPVNRRALEAAQAKWPTSWQTEWTKPENIVVNGPYKLASRRLNDRTRLVKNGDYWDADHVAFATIDALAIENASTAFNLYDAGEIDWVDGTVPSSLVTKLLPRDDFTPRAYMATYFYRVNTTKPPLDNKQIRKALFLTLNRPSICDKLLKAGQRPNYSVVPWGRLGSYVAPQTRHEDGRMAKALLKAAGFGPDGKKFPPLEILYNTSESHRDIAELVAETWSQFLDAPVTLKSQEWKSYVDAQTNLNYDVSRSSWIADYPDPLTFFAVFESDSENNRTGWKNKKYDDLVEAARREGDPNTRNALFQQAEIILIDELPIIPIYSYVSQDLVDPRLGGFGINALNDQSPKHWYWMDDYELQKSRKKLSKRERKVPSHGPREGLYSPALQAKRMLASPKRR